MEAKELNTRTQKMKIPSIKDAKYWEPDMVFKWVEYCRDLEHLIKKITIIPIVVHRDSHGKYWMESEEIRKLAELEIDSSKEVYIIKLKVA